MFDKRKYDIKFQKDNYDRLAINVKKGERQKIIEYAKRNGFESLTDYVKYLIYSDMDKDNKGTEKNISHNTKDKEWNRRNGI